MARYVLARQCEISVPPAATAIATTHSYSDTDSPQTTSNHEMTPPSNTTATTAEVTTHFSSDTNTLQTATTLDLEATTVTIPVSDPANPADTKVIVPV